VERRSLKETIFLRFRSCVIAAIQGGRQEEATECRLGSLKRRKVVQTDQGGISFKTVATRPLLTGKMFPFNSRMRKYPQVWGDLTWRSYPRGRI